jgi:hypothetical protein
MLRPGTRLGPYEIESPLGAGGMGEVYRARDSRLGRAVAIKVLPAEVASQPDRLARFEREAKAVAALSHPNIVAIHDFRNEDGTLFAVTELLQGKSLRERLAEGPLPVHKAIDAAVQIAHGLAAAHQRGIVHRDLKPDNLFLCADGRLKILDFGLAKVAPGADSETRSWGAAEPPATGLGVVLGTAGYMSPEQVRGVAADHRSDLFSFGAVLYEMVSGQRAFQAASAAETMLAILREEPPDLSAVNPSLPPGLDRIVRHCLEKSPEQRVQSAHDLAFELEGLPARSRPDSRALPALAARRGRRGTLAALAAGLIASFAAVYWLGAQAGSGSLPAYQRLTFGHGSVTGARFASDGQTIVYSAAWGGDPVEVFSTSGRPGDARPFALKDAMLLSLSRNDEMALLLRHRWEGSWVSIGTLARAPLSGGAPREIAEDVLEADWTPDGKDLAVIRGYPASRLELPLGHVLYQCTGTEWISDARVSPDGELVAFIDHPRDLEPNGAVAVVAVTGRAAKRILSSEHAAATGLAWHPGQREVWFTAARTGKAQALRAVSLVGRERLIAQAPGSLALDDISRDGRVLLRRQSQQAGISGVFPPGTEERELSWLDYSIAEGLSADGRVLLFDEAQEGGEEQSSFLRRTDGSPPVRLADDFATDLSPDGRWALIRPRGAPPRLLLVPTGPGEPRTIQHAGILQYRWALFMPDGQRLLFLGVDARHELRTYLSDLAPGPARPIAPAGVVCHVVSPDGRLAASNGTERGILLVPIAGGEPRPVPGTGARDRPIRLDGRFLYTYQRGEVPAKIARFELATGRRELWRVWAPRDRAGVISIIDPQLAEGGTYYAYSYLRTLSDLYLVHGLR